MDFGPYGTFPSSNVPKMVDQQNSWNSLVISTYLLYLYDRQHTPRLHRRLTLRSPSGTLGMGVDTRVTMRMVVTIPLVVTPSQNLRLCQVP
jgi:hypothetical protein